MHFFNTQSQAHDPQPTQTTEAQGEDQDLYCYGFSAAMNYLVYLWPDADAAVWG